MSPLENDCGNLVLPAIFKFMELRQGDFRNFNYRDSALDSRLSESFGFKFDVSCDMTMHLISLLAFVTVSRRLTANNGMISVPFKQLT